MFERRIALPPAGTETFFLWGPRQSGKTTLLHERYPGALWLDLLRADEYRRYLRAPETLRHEIEARAERPFVVIDEVQQVPALLDEVHEVHERLGVHFALCGSSASKVRRGGVNLLGGRAVRYELLGLVSAEIGEGFDLVRMLNHGFLPRHYLAAHPARLLAAYVGDYLKQEVAAEGLVRSLPAFSEFMEIAALSDTQTVNFSNIARECGVSDPTAKGYFKILEDGLLARWLPAYRKRPKRRIQAGPKLYFADVGLVNFLARRGRIEPGSELFGKAFESWVHHELRAWVEYSGSGAELAYWRLTSGTEVDFVVGRFELAIEAKASPRIGDSQLKGLRELAADHPEAKARIVVCLEPRERKTPDGIRIVPALEFVRRLWNGKLF